MVSLHLCWGLVLGFRFRMVIKIITKFTPVDRRLFMLGAGSLFFSSMDSRAQEKIIKSDALFASCIKKPNGSFGAVLLDQNYSVVRDIELSTRGHDVVLSKDGNLAVIFSRRPGNIATIINTRKDAAPLIISAPTGRHFYGHGVFSNNNKILFASENDFDNAVGKIGIYDVTDKFKRVGEFESFGIGPHEIVLLGDGKTLAVANGGIETHPDFGRAKLNLASMDSSIVFMNSQDGRIYERHLLPKHLQKLSLRHMVVAGERSVIFGGQYQNQGERVRPLMGRCTLGKRLRFWKIAPNYLKRFSDYTGSLEISDDQERVAISSPRGGVVGVFDTQAGEIQKLFSIEDSSGISQTNDSFAVSTLSGYFGELDVKKPSKKFNFAFDNHLTRFKL